MKKPLFTSFLLLFAFYTTAQFYNLPTPNPDSITDMVVYDRLGNQYLVDDLKFNLTPSSNHAIDPTCNAGIFRLTFADAGLGTGFDDPLLGPQRQAIACQVFTDLSVLINEANSPYSSFANLGNGNSFVEIEVQESINTSLNPMLGQAGQYYLPTSDGIVHGTVWETINTGIDSWLGVNNTNLGNYGIYHGLLQLNFGHSYYLGNNPNLIPSNEYDLYTVILHEAIHALGFGSLINQNGTSRISNTNPGIFGIYDTYLTDVATGNRLIDPVNCYTAQAIISPVSILTTPCSITFDGTSTTFVSTDATWSNGTSLSHYPIANCSNLGNYVMNPSLATGVTRRFPDIKEVTTLCDIGYSTSGSYPGVTYTSIGVCGTSVAGVNDYATYNSTAPGTNYQTPFNTAFNFSSTDILGNDENATYYECLEVVNASGMISGPPNGGVGNTIIFTPNTGYSGVAILKYIPRASATGIKGNTTYIFILVNPPPLPICTPNQCEMVCYGGFEEFTSQLQYDLHTQGSFAAGVTNDFSFAIGLNDNSPDFRNGPTNIPGFFSCGGNSAFGNTAHSGNNFIGLVLRTFPNGDNAPEGPSVPLNTPLLPGETATISIWAQLGNAMCNGGIEIRFTNIQPCSNDIFLGNCPSLIQSVPMQSVALTNNLNWQQLTYNYTNTSGVPLTYLLINSLPFQAYANIPIGYILIDDVSCIKNTPDITITKTGPTEACPNDIISYTIDVCNNSAFSANNVEVTDILSSGLSLVPGGSFNYPTQLIPNLPAGSCQSFTLEAQVDVSAGTVSNSATISSGGCLDNTTTNSVTTTISQPTLIVTQTTSNSNPLVGSTINLFVEVCNYISNPVNNILVETTIPNGNTILPGIGYTVSGNIISFNSFSLLTGTFTNPSCSTFTIPITVGVCSASGSICSTVLSGGNVCAPQNNCINLNVSSSPNISITSLTTSICPGESVTLTASGADTYTWDSGTFSGNPYVVTPSSNTIYTVTGTDANGCTATSTVTVTVGTNCCPFESAGNGPPIVVSTNGMTIPGGTTYTNTNFTVNGDITIAGNVTLRGCEMHMGADVKIIVQPGATLSINNSFGNGGRVSHLYACGDMWDGIHVTDPTSTVIITGGFPPQRKVVIEDAMNAVLSENGGNYTITKTNFNKNLIGIGVRNYPAAFPGTVVSSSFTCPTPITKNFNYTGSYYRGIPDPFGVEVVYQCSLFTGEYGWMGIAIENVGSNPLLSPVGVTIGVAGNNGPWSMNRNEFSNHDIAIRAAQSVVFANNNQITNCCVGIQGFDIIGSKFTGFGSVNVGIEGSAANKNTFNNCDWGVVANGVDAQVFDNKFNNIEYTAIDISHIKEYYSNIKNNSITNFKNKGINVWNNYRLPGLIIDNNTLNNSGIGAMGIGISIFNSHTNNSKWNLFDITNNTTTKVNTGILCINSDLLDVRDNTINVTPASGGFAYGIRLQGCWRSHIWSNVARGTDENDNQQFAIVLEDCQDARVKENEAKTAGNAMYWRGSMNTSTLTCNSFAWATNGVVLDGIVNANAVNIGSPDDASDNVWTNNYPFARHTYCVNNTDGANIDWYTRSFVGIYYPVNNLIDPSPLATSIGSTGNLFTNSSPNASCTIPCWNCPKTHLVPIAKDLVQYYFSPTNNKWRDKSYAFGRLDLAPAMMSGNSPDDIALLNFYNALLNSTIGKLKSVKKKIANGDIADATLLNDQIVAQNTLEQNQKTVNEIYLNKLSNGNTTYSAGQAQVLTNIAMQDVLDGGNAVYDARGMLGINKDIIVPINTNRAPTPLSDNVLDEKEINFALYPNPNDGNMTLDYSLNNGEKGEFVLLNATGKEIKRYVLNHNERSLTINELDLSTGIYFYKVFVNGSVMLQDKVIVSK